MRRVVIVGIVVMVAGCSARAQVPSNASREACTPIDAWSSSEQESPVFLIDGRAASRDDLTGTCEESIDRIEVLKGHAAAKYGLWADVSNGVVLVYTKTGQAPESR